MFIEPGHSVIDPTPPAYALLSQNVPQHLEDLRPADGAVLDPTDDPLHMFDDRLRPGCMHRLGRRVLGLHRWRCAPTRGHRGLAAASGRTALVQVPLLAPPFLGPIVGNAACVGLPLAMGLTAAKGTAQVLALAPGHVLAPGVPGIGEKEDAAVPTTDQAPSTVRLPSQQRSQDLVVLQHPPPNLAAAIPVPGKLKIGRDRYCKKAKLSLKMPTLDSMSSSYRIDTPVSSKVGRGFLSVKGAASHGYASGLPLGKKNCARPTSASGSI